MTCWINLQTGVFSEGNAMSWFWKSKSGGQKDLLPSREALAAEVDRLQTENTQALKQKEEWQAATESATHERDLIRSQSDEALSNANLQNAEVVAELTRKQRELEANLDAELKKFALLDQANISMAQMLKDRDQQIESIRVERTNDLRERDAKIEHQQQRLRELDSEIATTLSQTGLQIDGLKRQLAETTERTTVRILKLEQTAAANSSEAATRIASLEQQLAASEARSANRAEQRSALLRNMTEIHRLSTVSPKVEASSDSLKLLDSEWQETSIEPSTSPEAESVTTNPFFSTWSERAKSESA